jgi:hypothetical protein
MVRSEACKLKIFSDKSFLEKNQQCIPMLYPFFGENSNDFNPIHPSTFETYNSIGSHFFELTALENADLAVFPIPWEYVICNLGYEEMFTIFHDKADAYGIPTVIFFVSDSSEPVLLKNTIVFRTSSYRSTRKKYEYSLPAWSGDILTQYFNGQSLIRERQSSALIGFTGFAPHYSFISKILNNKIKLTLNLREPNQGDNLSLRSDIVKILQKNESIRKNIIIRNKFWGIVSDETEKIRQRNEFIQNLLNCDYSLCVRGAGNFSFRFYETLCCGRIPILVNTDCVFPYDFEIDWKKYCIWVESKDIGNIGEIIADYNNQITSQEFIDLQYRCREVWQNYLSPEGFFKNLFKHFAL